MAKYKGKDIVVFTKLGSASYKAIAFGTQCEVSVQSELIPVSSPTTGKYMTYKEKNRSWGVSSSHLLSTDNKTDILALVGQQVTLAFEYNETPATGILPPNQRTHAAANAIVSGDAICSKVTISAKNRDFVTVSMEFQGCGVLSGLS